MKSSKVQPRTMGGQMQADVVFELTRHFAVHSASVSLADHDLLRADSTGKVSSGSPGARGEWFDFLGDLGPNDSAGEAKLRIELDETGHDVLRDGALILGPALAIGIPAGLATSRLLASQLYGVDARDPWTLASVAVLLSLVAMGAALRPARLASRIDPTALLRQE